MRSTIGLFVDEIQVAAVLESQGKIEWRSVQPRDPERALADILEAVLAEFVPRRRLRPRVVASIACGRSAARRLYGLPVDVEAALATRIVHGQIDRFFCVVPDAAAMTPVVRVGEHWWGGHLDASTVRDLASVCARLRVPLRAVVPTEALAAPLTALHRNANGPDERVPGGRETVSADASLPDGNARSDPERAFASARLALRLALNSPFAIAPLRDQTLFVRRRRLRRALVVASLALLMGSLVLPGVLASRDLHRSRRAAAAFGLSDTQIRAAADDVRISQLLLDQFDSLGVRAATALAVLSVVSEAIPDSSVILSIRIERDVASLVVLSNDAAATLAAFDAAPRIVAVRVDGPITRENDGDLYRERFAARFRVLSSREEVR